MSHALALSQSSPGEFLASIERAGMRRTFRHGAGETVWRVWGRGMPLVLLHGGTGSWMHWVRNIEGLAHSLMLLVPDIPGSGESADPEPPISADRIAATLAADLTAIVGADAEVAIAGFSMGGLIAGYLARHIGTRAATLVLVGSTGTGARRDPMQPLTSWRRLPSEAEKVAAHRRNLGILMIHDPAKIDELAVHVQKINAERSRVRGKHVSHTGALADCVPGFQGRLAGIWGEFDATAVPYLAERGERLRQFQPQASFDVFPGAGHWVQYEAAERFNRRLAELVNGAA
jgi:2-hydroxy-6-oxonona-2,4-dienedioate hydrolase